MNNDRFKFRVWDNVAKRYIQSEEWCINCFGALHFQSEFEGDDIPRNEDEFIIEQCTGLRDKNGKLIYEGDIVLFVGKVNLAVQYTPNEWEMAGDDVNVPLTENTARFVKIVGNIHEGIE